MTSLAPAVYVPFSSLMGGTSEEWLRNVAPLVEAVEGFLPAGSTVTVHGSGRRLELAWAAGPSRYQVSSLISDILGKTPTFSDDLWFGWVGLDASLSRATPPAAWGFSLLSAALAGPCSRCEGFSSAEAFAYAYGEAFERPDSHLLSAHPNLGSLEALGVPPERLVRTAEVAGALFADAPLSSAEVFFHERGHLRGLLALVDSLTS